MNLVIDIGNSLQKVAFFEGEKLVQLQSFSEFDVQQLELLTTEKKIDYYILSSVGEISVGIKEYLQANFIGFELDSSTKLPISIIYNNPETLGVDRIAMAVGASTLFPLQYVLVIACGSCITYNMVHSSGQFLGGSISPGAYMRLQSMQYYTKRLPMAYWDGNERPELLAKNTNSALLSGAINGLIYEIDEVINEYKNTFSSQLNIILCGGDAKFFETELKNSIFADSNFVLYGLNEILKYNYKE